MAAVESFFLSMRELTLCSMVLRLFLAMFFGGVIGMERERRRRPAGFRTYMLVCLGAALTMILSQYLNGIIESKWTYLRMGTDITRLSAQVINGIGFLGAGTILATGRQEVKGLTTAAGLWSAACMGIAIGAGFYECVVPGVLFMLLGITLLPYFELIFVSRGKNMNIYVELTSMSDLGSILIFLKSENIKIYDIDLAHVSDTSTRPNAVLSLHLAKCEPHTNILARLSKIENICVLEEL